MGRRWWVGQSVRGRKLRGPIRRVPTVAMRVALALTLLGALARVGTPALAADGPLHLVLTPSQKPTYLGNRSRGVDDPGRQETIRRVVGALITR